MNMVRRLKPRNKNNDKIEQFKEQIVIGDRIKLRPAYTEGIAWIKGTVIDKLNRFVLVETDSGYVTAINYIDFIREDKTLEAKISFGDHNGT